jgi:hypothetical protein
MVQDKKDSIRGWEGDYQEQWEVSIDVTRKSDNKGGYIVERIDYTKEQLTVLEANKDWTCSMIKYEKDSPYMIKGRAGLDPLDFNLPGGFAQSVFKELSPLGYNPGCYLVGHGTKTDEYSGVKLEDNVGVDEKNGPNLRIFQTYFDGNVIEATALLEFFDKEDQELLNKVRKALGTSGFVRKNVVNAD